MKKDTLYWDRVSLFFLFFLDGMAMTPIELSVYLGIVAEETVKAQADDTK